MVTILLLCVAVYLAEDISRYMGCVSDKEQWNCFWATIWFATTIFCVLAINGAFTFYPFQPRAA